MRGMEYAVETVRARLELRLPAKTVELAGRLGTDTTALPPPGLVAGSDRMARIELNEYPAVLVVGRTVGRTVNAEPLTAGGFQLRRPYMLRVFCFVRADDFDTVAKLAQRYELAVEEVLLGQLVLAVDALVDPLSLVASFSESGRIKAGEARSLAAAYTDVSLILEEVTPDLPNLGVVDFPPKVVTSPLH